MVQHPVGPPPGLPDRMANYRPPWRRALIVIAVVLSVLVLAASLLGYLALRYYDGRINHVPLSLGDNRPKGAPRGAQNFLLVGSDSRAGTGGEFGEVAGQRSDTTILAHLSKDGTATLVSFPRDLYVRIPSYTDSRGVKHRSQQTKLNAAFSLGGPSLLGRTMESLTDIRVDHYLQIDFAGFEKMTNALGGVTVCLKRAPGGTNLSDRFSGFSGHVGINKINGAQALAFVRQRYGLPEGDLDRIRRQQQFLGAIFRKATSTGTLVNPITLTSFLSAATSALTTDNGTSLSDLRGLAVRLRGVGTGQVRFATVPTEGSASRDGQSVLLVDQTKLRSFLRGIVLDRGSNAVGAPDLAPAGAPGLAPAGSPGLAPAGSPGLAPAGSPGLAPAGSPSGAFLAAPAALRLPPSRDGRAVPLAQSAAAAPPAATACTY